MRSLITLLVLPTFFVTSLEAQTQTPSPDTTSAPAERRPLPMSSPLEHWKDFQRKFAHRHAHLRITILNDSKAVVDCDLKSISDEALQCRNTSHGRSTFQQSEISEVRWRHRDMGEAGWIAVPVAISGGLAYSTYVVAPILAASIPLAFFAFAFSFAAIGLIASLTFTIDEPVYVRPSEPYATAHLQEIQ